MKSISRLLPALILCSCGVKEGNLISSSESGGVTVKESTGLVAEIYLDGLPTGSLTPALVGNIPEGEHVLTLVKEGYQISSDTLSVQAGANQEISKTLQLAKSTANLELNSEEGVALWVDGLRRAFGSVVLSGLESGQHQIRVQKGNAVLDTTVNLGSSALSLKLSPQIQQWVLLEHFSNVACMPCPSVDHAVEQFLHEQNNPRIVHLSMHVNSPSPEDLFFTPFEGQILERIGQDYYSVGSVPRVMLDGVKTGSRQDSVAIPKYLADSLPSRFAQAPILGLDFASLQRTSSQVIGKLGIRAVQNISASRLKVALVEDEIHMSTAPGINGLSDFVDMFRGFAQTNVSEISMAAGQVQVVDFQINHQLVGRPLSVIAWVEDPTAKKVLQVYREKLPLSKP